LESEVNVLGSLRQYQAPKIRRSNHQHEVNFILLHIDFLEIDDHLLFAIEFKAILFITLFAHDWLLTVFSTYL